MAGNVRSAMSEIFENQLLTKHAPLIERWKESLDNPALPPLVSAADRYAMAMLLDTGMRELPRMEALQTTSVFGSNGPAALLGMTRKLLPRVIGRDLVSVQPLDRPTGKIFHLSVTNDSGHDEADYSNWLGDANYSDFSAAQGTTISKGMNLGITGSDIVLNTPKKLRVSTSLENIQDMQAYFDLNPATILESAATDEIARELDGLIVKAIYAAATAHSTTTFGLMPASQGWTYDTWRKRLQRAILTADNNIYRDTGKQGTFILAGIDAALELMDLSTFTLDGTLADGEQGVYGVQKLGNINKQYDVYRSRYLPANEMVVGRKGAGLLDAGIVFCPYILLYVSERVFNVVTQATDQSFMSRFNLTTVTNTLYSRIVIDTGATGIATTP